MKPTILASGVSKTVTENPNSMKIYKLFFVALLLTALTSCEDEKLVLNKTKEQSFTGSLTIRTSNQAFNPITGTSSLEISNGRFVSTTYVEGRGYGHSAGTLKISENKIHFTDTVFKATLMHLVPPFYISGTYDYAFDGQKLELGNRLESGAIERYAFDLKN